jgi:hypothetical protein
MTPLAIRAVPDCLRRPDRVVAHRATDQHRVVQVEVLGKLPDVVTVLGHHRAVFDLLW